MDNRLFFVIGDLVANVVCGTLAGLVAWAIVGTGWNMWLAMFAMMGLIMKYGNLREDGIAKSAFVYADAMMMQRQKGICC